MFTYGVSGDCVHLHLPGKLETTIKERGMLKTFYTVNLYLLDAIQKIGKKKQEEFETFKKCTKIYMVSPILIKKELEFLKQLDFDVQLHKIGPEDNSSIAKLIRAIFGDRIDSKGFIRAGEATLDFERIFTPEWQEKKAEMVEKCSRKGICIEEDKEIKSVPGMGQGEEGEEPEQ